MGFNMRFALAAFVSSCLVGRSFASTTATADACFSTELQASAIALNLYSSLWLGVTDTGCDDYDEIFSVYQEFFDESFAFTATVQPTGVVIETTTLEQYRAAAIETGTITNVCNGFFTSWAPQSVEIRDDGSFIWNAIQSTIPIEGVDDNDDILPGRIIHVGFDDSCNARVLSSEAVDPSLVEA